MDFSEISKEEIKKILQHKPNIHPDKITQLFKDKEEYVDIYEIEEIYNFLLHLDTSEFNVIIDYNEWIKDASSLDDSYDGDTTNFLTNHDYIENADLETLRVLMTTHIRTNRFVQGHLKQLFDEGYILKIMNRLEEIHDAM